MANIESGKIFDIDISISKFISEYGSSATKDQYNTWFVSQLSSSLGIDVSFFDLKKISDYSARCFLPFINQKNNDNQKLAFYLSAGESSISSVSKLYYEIYCNLDNSKYYVGIDNSWAYKDGNGNIQIGAIINPSKPTGLSKEEIGIIRFDTRFLDTHGFYTIALVHYATNLTVKKIYCSPNIFICNMINNINKNHFDGLIKLNGTGSYLYPTSSRSYLSKYSIESYGIIQNAENYYEVQGIEPQIFSGTGVKDSFTIVKLYFGESKVFKDIYLLRTDMSDIINNHCSFQQKVLTCEDGWDLESFSDIYGEKYAVGLIPSLTDFSLDNKAFTIVTKGVPKWEPEPEPVKGYLEFSSDEDFILSVSSPGWNGTIEYSIDNKSTWNTWDGSQLSGTSFQNIYLRGYDNSKISSTLIFTGKYCTGNIETLLNYQTVNVGNHPPMSSGCYANLFKNCTSLIKAPDLPATTLTLECYSGMFYGCTSLIEAPELPATTLNSACYQEMFRDCTSLIKVPDLLPATVAYDFCYAFMFYGCTSLTKAPKLPATTIYEYCYYYMFSECRSLTTIPKLPATTLKQYCYYRMFELCSSLKISASQTTTYKYEYRIPTSGTGVTAYQSVSYMFYRIGLSFGNYYGYPKLNTTYYTDHEPI